MQEDEFMTLFYELCVSFGKDLDKPRALIYFKYLNQFPFDKLKKAVEQYIFTGSQFFPSVAELTNLINPIDTGESWAKILVIAGNGAADWRELSDPEIAALEAIGGMRAVQMSDDEGLPFLFNQYSKALPVLVKRGIKYESEAQRFKAVNVYPGSLGFIKDQKLLSQPSDVKELILQIGAKI